MTLDEAYLAQYAGQITTCPNCQQPFTIPAAGAAAPSAQGPGVISYANPYASAGMLYDAGVGLVMQKNAVGPAGLASGSLWGSSSWAWCC
jgi:hypothetical protein